MKNIVPNEQTLSGDPNLLNFRLPQLLTFNLPNTPSAVILHAGVCEG
jgi:hypothetical protein